MAHTRAKRRRRCADCGEARTLPLFVYPGKRICYACWHARLRVAELRHLLRVLGMLAERGAHG